MRLIVVTQTQCGYYYGSIQALLLAKKTVKLIGLIGQRWSQPGMKFCSVDLMKIVVSALCFIHIGPDVCSTRRRMSRSRSTLVLLVVMTTVTYIIGTINSFIYIVYVQ